MENRLAAFQARRAELNDKVMATDHLGIKRFWNLDTRCYEDGALPARTKELLGLVASMVLRCDDCIDYHVVKCIEAGFTDAELWDAMNVGLVVGGSIVIPHLRHGVESVELARRLPGAMPDETPIPVPT